MKNPYTANFAIASALHTEAMSMSASVEVQLMKKTFSDTMIWVDEAHNVALTQTQLINRTSHVKEETYWTLHKLFHMVERMKIVLSSATPMLNHAGEIVSLVNLLRPENGKPPPNWNWRNTDKATFDFRFNTKNSRLDRHRSSWSSCVPHYVGQMNPRVNVLSLTDKELEQHFRGLFMYSRQDPVGVNVKYVGDVGKVNLNDVTSKNCLPGKRFGSIKFSVETACDSEDETDS